MAWQKGQSGNPAGRPKRGDTLADIVRSVFTKTRRRKLLKRALDMAEATDDLEDLMRVLVFLRDTLDGRPAQNVTLSGDEERPLVWKLRRGSSSAEEPR